MRIKTPIAVATCLICVGALLPVLSSQMNSSDGVAAVTKLENDQVKAALANDVSFIKTNLADDLVEGTSFGLCELAKTRAGGYTLTTRWR
jgi:hypothetical protein